MTQGWNRAAWLIVAREGPLTSQEVFERVPDGLEVADPYNSLWNMAHRGMLLTEGKGHGIRYKIDRTCRVPLGLTLGDVLEAKG